jgi:hypothetical protein
MITRNIFLLSLFFISINGYAQVSKTMKRLPDTGQTTSYATIFGEDNDYNLNIPTYINNNNGTIADTVTGLMWQAGDGGEMSIENAIVFCDSLTLGGYTNWRLPNAQESFSILNLQNANPALNTTYFTNTGAEYWWTSERQANDTNKIWCTNAGGGMGNHPRTETISAGGTKKFHVRAVRDVVTPITIPNHFIDNGDSTITDNLTNLIWQKYPNINIQNWEQALLYSENLVLANATDWRLPNIKELQSLNDENVIQPSVTAPYFQNIGVKKYWSSTSLPNQITKAWYWDTQFGITTYDVKTNSNIVICVRTKPEIPTAIFDVDLENIIQVYPNPFFDFIKIKDKLQTEMVVLTNVQGQIIYQGKEIELQDFSSSPKGIYFLKSKNQTIKLIKE